MTNEKTQSPRQEIPTLSSTLLSRVREMNPDGWSRLVGVFGPIVYRWCRQSGVPEHDAADVVQEVFASVARGIPEFERTQPTGSFRSWLATITRNRVRDHFRRSAKRPVARGGTDAMSRWNEIEEPAEPSFDTQDVDRLISKQMLNLVQAEFENRTWQAFWRTTIDGRPAVDVADELEMSPASVYQAKSRILRRLRQRLAEIPD